MSTHTIVLFKYAVLPPAVCQAFLEQGGGENEGKVATPDVNGDLHFIPGKSLRNEL